MLSKEFFLCIISREYKQHHTIPYHTNNTMGDDDEKQWEKKSQAND